MRFRGGHQRTDGKRNGFLFSRPHRGGGSTATNIYFRARVMPAMGSSGRLRMKKEREKKFHCRSCSVFVHILLLVAFMMFLWSWVFIDLCVYLPARPSVCLSMGTLAMRLCVIALSVRWWRAAERHNSILSAFNGCLFFMTSHHCIMSCFVPSSCFLHA